jgi:hypothetical protein
MDFNQLLAKMAELDQPAVEAVTTEAALDECPGDIASPPVPAAPSVPEPSMSLNLNAQGMDNIESLMKLMTKVNPDMINQPAPMAAPAVSPIPSLTPPGPSISSIGDLGNLDKGPLKMLPDLDSDDGEEGPEDDNKIDVIGLDRDGDGDHDMDDHDMEKKTDNEEPEDDDEKKEWANSLGDSEPETKDVDYMNNKLAGGMNRPKGTHPKVAGGDNPMQRVDTRESIRTELLQRLAEAKGVK